MMKPMSFSTRWVLVTGASSGLGWEMARLLAADYRANLIVVARRADRLQELKEELETTARVTVHPIVADLSIEEDVDRVFEQATAEHEVYGVILNAGITHFGPHLKLSWEGFQRMLATNVTATVRLTNRFVPYLIEAKQAGGIMLVTSLTGLIPVPYQTAYSATKAFLVSFGRGMYHELRADDVSITTFIPGGIMTEMSESSGLNKYWGSDSLQMQSAENCARSALQAFQQRQYMAIPGLLNRVQVFFSPFVPRRFLGNRMAEIFAKALQAAGK